MADDSLTVIARAGTAVDRPTATARRLVEASVSAHTRRAYAGALQQLDARLAVRQLKDAALAAYLAELHDAGRAASSAAMVVAAARFRAKFAGEPYPAWEATARGLAGYRRTAAGIERRVTAHSGRVGLGSELTSCGASTTDVMLAGNWKTPAWWRTTLRPQPPNAAPSRATSRLFVSC